MIEMKKRNILLFVLITLLTLCLAISMTACTGDDEGGGTGASTDENGDPVKSFTIECPTEMIAGERVEIIIKKSHDFSTAHDNYLWNIVGENTVDGEFVFEDIDRNDRYMNKFFTASRPGTVKIQVGYKDGFEMLSNEVTITVKGNEIKTVEELRALENSDKVYVLGADIDLSEEQNWKPIENFSGGLYGNGFKIYNLNINSVNEESIGLFRVLKGTVEDLTIENAQVAARGNAGKAGIVAGTNEGTVNNVTVVGTVTAEYYDHVGGLVGYNYGGKVTNCKNRAEVVGANHVGGVLGSALVRGDGGIDGNLNEGTVAGKDQVGGIAGYLSQPSEKADCFSKISNNTNKNTVTGTNCVGGVFGEVYGMFYGDWTNRYGHFELSVLINEAEVTGNATGNYTGGLIGKATRLNVVNASDNSADVTGGNYVGGWIGYAEDTNLKATGAKNNSTITGQAMVGGFAGYVGVIENAINHGEIVSTGILIEDGLSCSYVGGIAGYCTGLVGCENNSDISVEKNGRYIGGLAGYICVNANDLVNNNINYGTVTGWDKVGGIAGYLTQLEQNANITHTVSNNTNKGAITGGSYVGGIFGEVYGMYYSDWTPKTGHFEISVLTNNADVTGSATGSFVGGLIGQATRLSIITTCDNTGDVTGCSYVGGWLGDASGANIKATGATNYNTISGKHKVGGFAGVAGKIEYAINSGEIVILGAHESGEAMVGGIAGYCNSAIGCVNNSDMKYPEGGKYIGGIAGYVYVTETNAVNDNTNYGEIEGRESVGGIAGHVMQPSVGQDLTYTISNNANKNTVKGTDRVGGVFGEVHGMYYSDWTPKTGYFEVINCTNEAEITGSSYVGGIVGGYNAYVKTDDNLMETNTTLYGEKFGGQLS